MFCFRLPSSRLQIRPQKVHVIGPCVASLFHQIRTCGGGFRVWYKKKNANGKPTPGLDFTSFNGDERKKVLRLLPEKLAIIIPNSYAGTVNQLWKNFQAVYSTI